MEIAEIFGHSVEDHSAEVWLDRTNKHCRFRNSPCTKSSKTDPLAICSLSNGSSAAALCPVRFLEKGKIFRDAASIAFGSGFNFGIFPEIRILEIASKSPDGKTKKIGKVDFLLGKIEDETVTDFAAVEIQAAYFSGTSLRPAFKSYNELRSMSGHDTNRRPDFRSCAQKRLMPQLQLKIPVFRRWGKKFFVVVDKEFFKSLPPFERTSQSNSELTWLIYPIEHHGLKIELGNCEPIFSGWDDVQNSLREGRPPEPEDIVQELQAKLSGPDRGKPIILTS